MQAYSKSDLIFRTNKALIHLNISSDQPNTPTCLKETGYNMSPVGKIMHLYYSEKDYGKVKIYTLESDGMPNSALKVFSYEQGQLKLK